MSYWLPVVIVLGLAVIAAIFLIVRRTHTLPASEPLHQDPHDLAAPLPLDVAVEDAATPRELESERETTTPTA